MSHFDHIIVGGGTSGCIVAARLAEAGKKVALFEIGPSDENDNRIKDLTKWPDMLGTELDFDYKIEPQLRGNSLIKYSRARVLGGCSSHNSCIAFYTPPYDLYKWCSRGAHNWDPDSVKPFFDKIKQKISFESAEIDNEFIKNFIGAANKTGYPTIKFNHDDNDKSGVGWFDLNKKGTIRESSSIAYLHPLSKWKNKIEFYLNTRVNKIIIKDKKAVGIQTSKGEFYTNGEIIICCGAIDTPKLLLLSGIGPKKHLQDVGVTVIQHLDGVGNHLVDHPEGVLNWELTCPMPKEFIY